MTGIHYVRVHSVADLPLFAQPAVTEPEHQPEPDICAGRHGGNAESQAAQLDRRARASEQRARVLQAVIDAGAHGITADELAVRWHCGLNAISGRFTELHAARLIQATGHRPTRTGSQARVWVGALNNQAEGRP